MKKVMLHYINENNISSTNIINDRIENNEILKTNFEFIHLNQDKLASVDGNIRVISDLYKKIKKNNPDIIHICGVKDGFHCTVAAWLARVPKRILITHGFMYNCTTAKIKKIYYCFFEILTLFFSTHIQCNSKFSMSNPIVKVFAKKKSRVIYNLVDYTDIKETISLRKKYNIKQNDFVIYSVGRIVEDKGFDTIVKVILEFKECDDVKFIITGDGHFRKKLLSNLEGQIKIGQVIYTGKLPNKEINHFMSMSNLFFLPTRHYETFGLVFVEAALQKTPSLTANSGAINEVVKNDVTGYIINDSKDIDAFINKIYFMKENRDITKKMGENAYSYARDTFDAKRIGKLIYDLYEE